jgi:hypothetical protein
MDTTADSLAARGTMVTAVLGNPGAGDFELVDVTTCPLAPETQADFHRRGLGYCATFAMVNDEFESVFEVPLSPWAASALAKAYARLVIAKQSDGDGAEWLSKLHSLPDTREN